MFELTTLNCRLLCACEIVEEIQNAKTLPPFPDPSIYNPLYYTPIGFLKPPRLIAGGPVGDIDACIVGTNADGVILAFRGTLMPAFDWPSILDWIQNFLAVTISVPGLPGKVHAGFFLAVTTIWKDVLAEVQAQMKDSGKGLIVTGHSKGAAMATIASMLLHNAGVPVQDVVTIASPNAGNSDFATAYDAIFTQTRYTNHLDIVPFLPPTPALAAALAGVPDIGWLFKAFETANYAPVGNGIYIDGNGSTISRASNPIVYDAAILADLVDITNALVTLQLLQVARSHFLTCGFGYMKGICQGAICS